MNLMYKSYNITTIESIYRIFKLEKNENIYKLMDKPELYITKPTNTSTINNILDNFKSINNYFSSNIFRFKSINEFIDYYSILEKERTKRKRKYGNFLSEFLFTIDPNLFKRYKTDNEILDHLVKWINKTNEFVLEKLFNDIYIEDTYTVFSDEYYPILHVLFSPVIKTGYKYKLPGPPYYLNVLYKEILLII
jgi:hypothetical protein